MKGDFSRLTFDPKKHFRAVRMQQGRVQLDADWNEQIDILTYVRETELRDVLGPSGAPAARAGFKIHTLNPPAETIEEQEDDQYVIWPDPHHEQKTIPPVEIEVGSGRYYVHGILCESEQDISFTAPVAHLYPETPSRIFALAYLDVWTRFISAAERPELRETALGGIDTAARERTAWQVGILPVDEQNVIGDGSQATYEHTLNLPEWRELIDSEAQRGTMSVRHSLPTTLDNHLYRVEIHHVHGQNVSFKWSRENASLLFALDSIKEIERKQGRVQYITTLSEHLRDDLQLRKGDWVEIVDAHALLENQGLPLYQVVALPDVTNSQITLAGRYSAKIEEAVKQKTPLLLRRWDYDLNRTTPLRDGTLSLQTDSWIDLERGIQVYFPSGGLYRTGDYWLFPTRSLSNTIEWPSAAQTPLALPPHGIDHRYCPLALLHLQRGQWRTVKDLRRHFTPLPIITTFMEKASRQAERPTRTLVEICESQEELHIGDVVSLVPTTNNSIIRADHENARMVLGVVAAKEARGRDWHYHVTIYGRARCRVVGLVEWGDLLTVSHRHGCARVLRLDHIGSHHGTIIGKALEAYLPDDEDMVDMVEIMVTLQ